MGKQPEYGKFPIDALEEITQNGITRFVHPNTAIMLRAAGKVDEPKKAKKTQSKGK